MDIEKSVAWATHQPVIKSVLELYRPESVLELGVGIFSTPLFRGMNYLGVETSKYWCDFISVKYEVPVLYHDLNSGIALERFYASLPYLKQGNNLLFVDSAEGSRVTAINTLSKRYDIIIYHDCEPHLGYRVNQYDLIEPKGFVRYVLKTNLNWTGLMVRSEINLPELSEVIIPHIVSFRLEYPNLEYMTLTKL